MRIQSLAPFLAKSSIISLVAAFGLLAGASASAGDPVYKWKDANGQSHYSQQPPDGVKYETITTSGEATVSSAPAAASPVHDAASAAADSGPTPAKMERQKYCASARKNVDTLSNKPLVQMDVNGDGKQETLTTEQQAHQLDLAKQQVVALCH